MLSITSGANRYQVPVGTIFDEDVSVWTLTKYIFKVMFAFILVNAILTLPVLLVFIVIALQVTGVHLPADHSR